MVAVLDAGVEVGVEVAAGTDEVSDLAGVPTERIEAELTELAGHLAAAECRWVLLIGEFDRRRGWADWGCRSCARWLNWKCGLSHPAARDRVRVAHALAALPRITAEFAAGRLSYSKVRALTRVATTSDEADLVDFAHASTASMIERFVRAYRSAAAAGTDKAEAAHEGRSLTYHTDYDDGSLVIAAKVPPEVGALLLEALAAAEDWLPKPEPEGGGASAEAPSRDQRAADALAAVCQAALGDGLAAAKSTAARPHVVIHADVGLLAGDEEEGEPEGQRCHVEDGAALAAETARRLACDAGITLVVEDEDGHPLDVGRRTRTVPPALRRALQVRSVCCDFPGCAVPAKYCDAHHITHWVDGGPTNLGNLANACGYHHWLVHEGGYTCERLPDGSLRYRRPDGSVIPPEPGPVGLAGPDIRARNHAAGITIAPDTVTGNWCGDHLDLDYAVAAYMASPN